MTFKMAADNSLNLNCRSVLIIGIDGNIGSSLYKFYLSRSDVVVYGTTRRRLNLKSNIYYLDLLKPDLSTIAIRPDTVIFCASYVGIKNCEINKEIAQKINVDNTLLIIDYFLNLGSFIIYLSSNMVFDGKKAFYDTTDQKNPVTKYGLHKHLVESSLNQSNAAVLRLTKVIFSNSPFILKWEMQRNANLPIDVYINKLISPIDINSVVKAIFYLDESKSNGIFHLGGNVELSYYEFAKKYFDNDNRALSLLNIVDNDKVDKDKNHNSLRSSQIFLIREI